MREGVRASEEGRESKEMHLPVGRGKMTQLALALTLALTYTHLEGPDLRRTSRCRADTKFRGWKTSKRAILEEELQRAKLDADDTLQCSS